MAGYYHSGYLDDCCYVEGLQEGRPSRLGRQIPVYNSWVMFEIGGKPGWIVLLSFIPIINLVVVVFEIIVVLEIAKRFGKSGVFGFFLLFLLPFIGWPILGYGKAQYNGALVDTGGAAAAPPATTPPVTPVQPEAQPPSPEQPIDSQPPVPTPPADTPPTMPSQ